MKMLHERHTPDPAHHHRFSQEASLAARMLSPHVVKVLGLAVTHEEQPCIVYEHLVGETLAEKLEREGALDVDEAADVVEQTARGLARAHQIGVLHRDVKPDNIFLAEDTDGGTIVKLLDFGVAEAMGRPLGTATDELVGTPEYIAPEVLFASRPADVRSDLYGLGVVAFECLTGRCPIAGPHIDDILLATARGERARLHELRPDFGDELAGALEAFFTRALHEDPFWRYPTARELAEAFREAVVLGRTRPATRQRAA